MVLCKICDIRFSHDIGSQPKIGLVKNDSQVVGENEICQSAPQAISNNIMQWRRRRSHDQFSFVQLVADRLFSCILQFPELVVIDPGAGSHYSHVSFQSCWVWNWTFDIVSLLAVELYLVFLVM